MNSTVGFWHEENSHAANSLNYYYMIYINIIEILNSKEDSDTKSSQVNIKQ